MNRFEKILATFVDTTNKRAQKGILSIISAPEKGNVLYESGTICSTLSHYLDNMFIQEQGRSIVFKMSMSECKYFIFAHINNIKIALDLNNKNEAGEWNIVNLDTKYIVTKTMGRFFGYKIWAWLDRGKDICNE